MHSQPKVSVVVTCYNYARFLPFALESALGQSYKNIEVIVVNDGSTDNTDDIMQGYLADPRVLYIKQDNAGQSVSKNVGIRAATGEFVAFLDADDVWEMTKLEKQVPLFTRERVGVVYSRMDLIDEGGTRSMYSCPPISTPRSGRITEELFVDNIVPFSSAVVRKTCFSEVGVMNASLKMAIDWDLWLRMSVHYEFEFVDEPLLLYRVGHSGQMSKNYFVREKDQMTIMRSFIADNPALLPDRLVKWVMAYSCCNRGYHFRSISLGRSLSFYAQALRWRWHHGAAFLGILKLPIFAILRMLGASSVAK